MNEKSKKQVIRAAAGGLSSVLVFVVLLLHNAWGDDRYVLREDDIREQIQRIDTHLTIKDTEILFAETDREKEKLRAIKAIYERKKQALQAELGKD